MSQHYGRIFHLILCLGLVLMLVQATPVLAENTDNIYVIDSKEDFFAIMDIPYGHYRLEADLDLGEIISLGATPGSEDIQKFAGVLDGNGHTISYSMTETPGVEHYGLFAGLYNADIFNLNICADIRISKSDAGSCYVGIVAGDAGCVKLAGVHVSGTIQVHNSNPDTSDVDEVQVGGLFGSQPGNSKIRSCSVDTQVDLNCSGGVQGYYGGFYSGDRYPNSASHSGSSRERYVVSSTLSGSANLNGRIGSAVALYNAQNCVCTQEFTLNGTNDSEVCLDLLGINNVLSGNLEILSDAGVIILNYSDGSVFNGTVHTKEGGITCANKCNAVTLNGNVRCESSSEAGFCGMYSCEDSTFDMDASIECNGLCRVRILSEGENNGAHSDVSVINHSAEIFPRKLNTEIYAIDTAKSSSYEGKISVEATGNCACAAIARSSDCIFIGSLSAVSSASNAAVYGADAGTSGSVVRADLNAEAFEGNASVRPLSTANDSKFEGTCTTPGSCYVIQYGENCVANAEVKAHYCNILSVDTSNCYVTGSVDAYETRPVWGASNGYVNMNVKTQSDFIVEGTNCLFEGNVEIRPEKECVTVTGGIAATVYLADGTVWDTTKGPLYQHQDVPCSWDHPYQTPDNDFTGCYVCRVSLRYVDLPKLSDITSQWPEYMQPGGAEEEPEDGSVQLSLHETADCEDSTRITSMLYSCGNFSWERTVTTEEAEKTDYSTCYLKITKSSMAESGLMEVTAPNGFSFRKTEMVSSVILSVPSGTDVQIPVYPIYSASVPTENSKVIFLVDGRPYSTGTSLSVNDKAGTVTMRNSFDTSGNSVWTDQLTPDFSGLAVSSFQYNKGLAQIGAAFAAAAYKYDGVQDTLLNFGFSNIQRYNYNPENDQLVTDMGRHMVAATFATKQMVIAGKIETVVAVVIRGTVSEEWYGNFAIGNKNRHSGFETAREYLAPTLFQYLADYTTAPANTKIIITGHSRGAAVADLIAADLNNKYQNIFAAQEDIYTYTFATPNSTKNETSNNVFNIINPTDIVTAIPDGFYHVGQDRYIATKDSPDTEAVLNEFSRLTQGTQTFQKWGESYTAVKNLVLMLSRCSDQSWFLTQRAAITCSALIFRYTPRIAAELYSMVVTLGGYSDEYDLRTTGDVTAAFMLRPAPENQEANKIQDAIWSNHSMEFYYSWMKVADTVEVEKTPIMNQLLNKILIRCPVDVHVYDADGMLVASIVNDQVIVGAGETCDVLGDQKYFLLDGSNYRFDITGYDSGLVDISVTEYSMNYDKTGFSIFRDLNIQKGDTFTMYFNRTAEQVEEKCYVTSTFGNIYPEVKNADELENSQITLECNGTGMAMGAGEYEPGELVILTAEPAEEFLGWYENSRLVSTDPEITFECEEDRSFVALFSDGEMEHIHEDEEVITAPTCTEGGYTTYTCSCGDSYVIDETDALGHDFGGWYVTKEPTEETEGEEQRNCSRCEESEIRSIPKLDHVHSYTATVTAPTCTEGGYTTYTCACGDSYVADETAALGHSFGAWFVTKNPTEESEGVEQRNCSRCEESEIRSIPKLEHVHDYTSVVTVPTCTDKGYATYTCKCGASYVADETAALGHDFGAWFVTKEPTEESEGEEQRNCSRCNESETRVIAKLDHVHDYAAAVTEPTCTEGGYTTYTCECGDSYVADKTNALGHDYQGGTCSRCGEADPDYAEPVVNPFTDVKERHYFYQPVLWAVKNGITSGTSATTFSPDEICTRGQVVTFLWRAMGEPEPGLTVNPFTDVREKDYYYKAVLWAVENGITSGTSAGTFSPKEECTRGQVVTFLHRALGNPAYEQTQNPFGDVRVKDYFYTPVLWAVENGVTSGTSASTFSPKNACTRGQVVTFLYRAIANQ